MRQRHQASLQLAAQVWFQSRKNQHTDGLQWRKLQVWFTCFHSWQEWNWKHGAFDNGCIARQRNRVVPLFRPRDLCSRRQWRRKRWHGRGFGSLGLANQRCDKGRLAVCPPGHTNFESQFAFDIGHWCLPLRQHSRPAIYFRQDQQMDQRKRQWQKSWISQRQCVHDQRLFRYPDFRRHCQRRNHDQRAVGRVGPARQLFRLGIECGSSQKNGGLQSVQHFQHLIRIRCE